MLVYVKAKKYLKNIKNKRSYYYIPFIFTYLNAIFGFISILKAFEAQYSVAALFVMLAAVMDCLDGRAARAFGSTSYFGMELDSLCDVISFCLAPIILVYCWADCYFDNISYFFISALLFYLCAGLARLAKFNLNSEKQQYAFDGLPTTISAIFICLFILYHSWFHNYHLDKKSLIAFSIDLIAILMLIPIKFYAFKNKTRLTFNFTTLLFILLIMLIIFFNQYPISFFLIMAYIFVNLIIAIIHKVFYKLHN